MIQADPRTAVLVTGSREWRDYAPIKERLDGYPIGTILLHGDCGRFVDRNDLGQRIRPYYIGADKIAADLGRHKFNVWPLPYFSDLKKQGGHARNGCLVNLLVTLARSGFACSVEAFPWGPSTGTRGCIEKAKSAAVLTCPQPLIIRVTEGV